MSETNDSAPYGGYTGPVRFVVKNQSPGVHPLTGNREYSSVVMALDDQGNVLDSYKTGRNTSRERLKDEINRYQATVNANISGSPTTIMQNYGSESVTINPGSSMTEPYQAVRVGEDGSLQIRTVDQRGIRVAPTITTAAETVPAGAPVGAVDITNLPSFSATQPAATAQAMPQLPVGLSAQAMPQLPVEPLAGIQSLLPATSYLTGMRPVIGPQTMPMQLGTGERLMADQRDNTLPFSYIPGQYR